MKPHLGKLARLTRGAALIGIGAGVAGCSKTDRPARPHETGPLATGEPSEDSGAADASPLAFRRHLPVPNAIPKYLPQLPDAGRAKDGGDAPP
jgi:hypothetical protein